MHVEYTYIRLCEKPKHTIVDLRRLKMTFCIDIQLGCCVVSQRALESSFLWFHNEHCNGFLFDVTRSTWVVLYLISQRALQWFLVWCHKEHVRCLLFDFASVFFVWFHKEHLSCLWFVVTTGTEYLRASCYVTAHVQVLFTSCKCHNPYVFGG
jgi:hypothetical protein